MSKTNTFENDILKLILQATAITNIADNAASSPFTTTYISLHTADPGETGTQSTSEATYTSYGRVAISRASGAGGWTITGNSATPTDGAVNFPKATGGTNAITHFGVGTSLSGTGKLLYSGALDNTINVSTGVTPTPTITITED